MMSLKALLITGIIIAAGVISFTPQIPFKLGLDLQGGIEVILEAKDTATAKVDNDAILGILSVIRNRVDGLGVGEPVIQQKGARQIIVQLPGIKDPQRAIDLIGKTALLEFVKAEWAIPNIQNLSPEKQKVFTGENGKIAIIKNKNQIGEVTSEQPVILRDVVLTGKYLKNAYPGTNEYGEPIVNIEFDSEGAKIFYEISKKWTGKPLAILLDGKIVSAPNINEPIPGGRAQISGNFSIPEMKDLVIQLKAGALPLPVEIISNKIVGPSLGKDSIEKSKLAGLIGLSFVLIFMIISYRRVGIVAAIALISYIVLISAILKLIGATLTLPGIAGLILTIGMAVDANVIIFERIKEERKQGHPLPVAIQRGFKRAFVAIVDANITTLIAAGVLFWLGTGTIKGFALTLSIGILLSMFTSIVLSKMQLNALKDTNMFKVKS